MMHWGFLLLRYRRSYCWPVREGIYYGDVLLDDVYRLFVFWRY